MEPFRLSTLRRHASKCSVFARCAADANPESHYEAIVNHRRSPTHQSAKRAENTDARTSPSFNLLESTEARMYVTEELERHNAELKRRTPRSAPIDIPQPFFAEPGNNDSVYIRPSTTPAGSWMTGELPFVV